MSTRSCRVTITDMEGVAHTVKVTAATLYEAVALGLAAIRGNDWVSGIAEGLNVVRVRVTDIPVEHAVKLSEFLKWLEREDCSPRKSQTASASVIFYNCQGRPDCSHDHRPCSQLRIAPLMNRLYVSWIVYAIREHDFPGGKVRDSISARKEPPYRSFKICLSKNGSKNKKAHGRKCPWAGSFIKLEVSCSAHFSKLLGRFDSVSP